MEGDEISWVDMGGADSQFVFIFIRAHDEEKGGVASIRDFISAVLKERAVSPEVRLVLVEGCRVQGLGIGLGAGDASEGCLFCYCAG